MVGEAQWVSQVDGWLQEIGAAVGVELQLDADLGCAFECAHGLIVSLSLTRAEDGVALHTHLLPPRGDEAAFFRDLLVRNHHFAGTQGCTLAYDNVAGQVALCRLLPSASLDREGFRASLAHFISTAASLHEELAHTPPPHAPTDAPAVDTSGLLRQFGTRV
jgi:hypothetical protein